MCVARLYINTKLTYIKNPSSSISKHWLAQLGERGSAEREVAGSKPGRTNTYSL